MFETSNLEEYVLNKYGKLNKEWFIDEVKEQQFRVSKVNGYIQYLKGKHKILKKQDMIYKDGSFTTSKTIFNNAANIIDFGTSYLLANRPTFTGEENRVKVYNNIYKKFNYYKIDNMLLDKTKKYGDCGEFIYKDTDEENKAVIKSYIIRPENFYPIYNDSLEYVGAIEHWRSNNNKIKYFRIYYKNKVQFWNNQNGFMRLIEEYKSNYLPIHWHNFNESCDYIGYSELENLIPIFDSLEQIVNKFGDAILTIITNPILCIGGDIQNIDIERNAGHMQVDGIGYMLAMETDGKVWYPDVKMDYENIKLYVDLLKQQLSEIGSVPSVFYGQSNIANVSETVIKQLYQCASNKAKKDEIWFRDCLKQRWMVIDKILKNNKNSFEYLSEDNNDSIDIEFNYNRPSNDSELIDNICKMRGIEAMSSLDAIERNPLLYDTQMTVKRLKQENNKDDERVEKENFKDEVNQKEDVKGSRE